MPSLYAKYIYEREGKSIKENEFGFATYYFLFDMKAVYIEDIYVVPEKRRSRVASQLAEEIFEEAKSKGYTKALGTVKPKSNGATTSLKALLAYGFTVDSCDGNLIYLFKEI